MTTIPTDINEIITECFDIYTNIYAYAQDYSTENHEHYNAEDLALEVV